MSNKKRLFRILSLCILTNFLAPGCLKNDNTTIALPEIGTAANVIPPEIRNEFESKIEIHEGVNPPDITGSFIISKTMLKYSSDGASTSTKWSDIYIAFHNKKGNTYEFNGKQNNSEEYSPSVVVIGGGSDFTAYFTTEQHYDDGKTWAVTADLISGTITGNGIRDLTHAFIMLKKYDPDDILMDVNEYRIFYDQDGLSSNHNWFQTKSSIESEKPDGSISIHSKSNK